MLSPLPYELLGLLALAILWVNTLLIAAAAFQRIRALARLSAALRVLGPDDQGVGLVIGRVARGDGDDGTLVTHHVEQVGRLARGEPTTIVFEDRSHASASLGGAIERGERSVEIPRIEGDRVEVWPDRRALEVTAECPSAEAFDAALPVARKAKGFVRGVTARIAKGDDVYVVGTLERRDDGTCVLGPSESAPLIISSIDPRRFCATNAAKGWLFIVVILALAAGITALATTEPHLGTWSKIGGALGLAFFLLVQPAGTALRDAVARPNQAALRGIWRRPTKASLAAGATSPSNA